LHNWCRALGKVEQLDTWRFKDLFHDAHHERHFEDNKKTIVEIRKCL